MEQRRWYSSVHSGLFSLLQISAVIFMITAIVVFAVLYFPVRYLVQDEGLLTFFSGFLGLVAFVAALIVTGYAIGVVLYKISFDKNGITVKSKIFGKVAMHQISYSQIQFIQLYTRKSTVRHNPKLVIVVNENSKYEVMLKSDAEGDELKRYIPDTLLQKIV